MTRMFRVFRMFRVIRVNRCHAIVGALAMGLGLLVMAAACDMDSLSLYQGPDLTSVSDGAARDADGLVGRDGGDGLWKDACAASGTETCDGKDNDCNGTVDDVDTTKLASDMEHCGACFQKCALPNAYSKCQGGQCLLTACAPGFYDINQKSADGCEYACLVTNQGQESCDALDNDCNGTVDDGYNKLTDIKNCGICGNICLFANAAGVCKNGVCSITQCNAGYANLDKNDQNGCEYTCPTWPPLSSDGCDGLDSDCDGTVDEDFTAATCGSTVGQCKAGTYACQGGTQICLGATLPQVETCNNLDDDCDNAIDNGFDKQNDPRYCLNCLPCSLPNAVANCTSGVCGIAACKTGYVDQDKDPKTGCEYACTVSGLEICDGEDNDCNGKIDDGVSLSVNICKTLGPCSGATAVCKGTDGWQCAYGSDVELQPCLIDADCGPGYTCQGGVCPGIAITDEKLCDGKDGDCDGKADDPFLKTGAAQVLGQACSPDPTKKGICAPKGVYACTAAKTGLECSQTAAGLSPKNEECNALDDDCDGKIDESTDDGGYLGVRDSLVHVNRSYGGKTYDFYIYSYEASRPDAGSTASGTKSERACSRAGVLPWGSVTYKEAAAACLASGKRLCTATEWLLACQGPSSTVYPYGASYQKTSCNGLDQPSVALLATGSLTTCQGGETGLFDMSGNLREWTNDKAGTTTGTPAKSIYVVRGGGYNTPGPGLSCGFTMSQAVEDVVLPTIGFRCCADKAP